MTTLLARILIALILIAIVLISITLDRHDRRGAHPERELRVAVLEHNAHREALRQPHPVQRRVNLRQALDARAVLLIERPSHALHAAAKALVGIGEDENLCAHAGFDVREKRLAEIRDHVPLAIVDQADDLPAFVGVLALRDVEISDVAVIRRADVAVTDVEFCVVNGGLGGFAQRVDVAVLAELVLRLADVGARGLDRSLRGVNARARVEDVVGGDEMPGQKRLNPIEVLPGICGVGFEPNLIGLRGPNRILERLDIELGQLKLGGRGVQYRFIWPRIDDEQQVALLDILIVDDRQFIIGPLTCGAIPTELART